MFTLKKGLPEELLLVRSAMDFIHSGKVPAEESIAIAAGIAITGSASITGGSPSLFSHRT